MAAQVLADRIRLLLASGPLGSQKLLENLGVSQPTFSRAAAALGDELVRMGAARSIRYALRDPARGLPGIAVFRVDDTGRVAQLGVLIPVRPAGFVMRHANGSATHCDGLPWWLHDMRPQGYLGRAYAARHGAALGLPERLGNWNDTHVLRALLAHGQDAVGDLLLGEATRNAFLAAPTPAPVTAPRKARLYPQLARDAAAGGNPGSSAGGEQPKFTAYASTPEGGRHLIVKFSEAEPGPVTERWRDLLLAEHLALETLHAAAVPAARTWLGDHEGQRFLEVARFDRVGALGRRALISLAALDAEFVGIGSGDWPRIAAALATGRQITADAADAAFLLWAFGALIGNTDMHNGNLSFIAAHAAPCEIAPAYDMSPMAFAPRSGGGLPETLASANLHPGIPHATWRRAEALARDYLAHLRASKGFSPRFTACIAALGQHIENAASRIARLG